MPSITVYPDPSSGATTVDGVIHNNQNDPGGVAWATLHDVAAGTTLSVIANPENLQFVHGTTANQFRYLDRYFALFDTSPIADTDIINTATLSINGTNKAGGGGTTYDFNIFSSTPASNNNLVLEDYDQVGSTAFSTAITYDGWSITGYNAFTLNASGRANINKTGISKFSGRNGLSDGANVAPTWSSGLNIEMIYSTADAAGTSTDPKLVVNSTKGGGNLLLLNVG